MKDIWAAMVKRHLLLCSAINRENLFYEGFNMDEIY